MRNKLLLSAAICLSLFTASRAQTLPSYLPTDGLVGWWPFNGNANDESGNGNNGIPSNIDYTTDRFGALNNALFFELNGGNVDDNPSFITVPGVLIQGDYTCSYWIYHNSIDFGYQIGFGINNQVIGRGYGIVSTGFTNEPYTANCGSPAQVYGAGDSEGACYNGFYSEATYIINSWQHVVLKREGNTVFFYINGAFDNSVDTLNINPIDNLVFGRRSDGWFGFNGTLDDIAIYNRALSPEEITALYTGEPVNPPTACNPLPANLQNGLVGYWPFCGNANDESGNGNDGTVNGATLTEDRFGVANAAYEFDGLNDYTEILNSSLLEFNEGITFAAWIKPTNYQLGGVIDKSGGSVGGFRICTRPLDNVADWNDRKLWVESTQYASGYGSAISENNYLLNDWQLVVGTFNPITNNCSLYLNGVLEDTSVNNAGNVNNLSSNIKFGLSPTVTPEFFSGAIDDIGIWNRALTPDEVQQLYTLNACSFTIYDTVTVTQTVYDTVTTYTTVTDTLIINTLITELAPPANTNTIKVFPNPAGSILTIDYGNYALMNGYQLRIENSLGQEVFQTNISQQSDTLNLGTWGGNGLYFVHIVNPQGNTVDIRKIVLQ